MSICARPNKDFSLDAKMEGHHCKYHQKGVKHYSMEELGPQGLCLEAYHTLYPYAFALLYNANFRGSELENSCLVKCPRETNELLFMIQTATPSLKLRIKNIIKKAINIFYPNVIESGRIFMDMINGEGCPYDLSVGDKFEFNQGDKPEICPAGFNSVYPFIFPYIYGKVDPKGGDKNGELSMSCPDHIVDVKYKLQSPAGFSAIDPEITCGDYKDIEITTSEIKDKCDIHSAAGQKFSVDDILKDLGFPCLAAFHTLFPYYLTLLKGGSMKFYTNNKFSAMVQCPNPDVKVEMYIVREKGNISVEITNVKGACPKGLEKNKKFIFPKWKPLKFCIFSLSTLYPYLNFIKYGNARDSIKAGCPGCGKKGRIIYDVRRK